MAQVMAESREACVDYMMPLGLHHIFKFDHHYGPEPDGFIKSYPLEWCPVYYHKADKQGVGFERSSKGTDAVSQYRKDLARTYDNINTESAVVVPPCALDVQDEGRLNALGVAAVPL